MSSFLFVLGRSRELARAELASLFPSITDISEDIVLIDDAACTDETVTNLMNALGGTVKIARYLGTFDIVDAAILAPYIDTTSSITYGVSGYGVDVAGIARNMKPLLSNSGHAIRYIEQKHDSAISTVVSSKEHVQELIVTKSMQGYVVGKVVAVQPFEDWSRRDYGRPYADAKSGMLPPKVSRMIINCALGNQPQGKTILDPFCGMGTVVAEALMRGATAIGSDQSEDGVIKAQKNIEWLKQAYSHISDASFFTADATHVSEFIPKQSIDAIVTEPFMGAPIDIRHLPTEDKAKNTIKGLEKLYIGCFKDWSTVLKPDGCILIALPKYMIRDKTYFVKKIIDTCENFGYTIATGPIEYSRPQAVVKREFYKFKKI